MAEIETLNITRLPLKNHYMYFTKAYYSIEPKPLFGCDYNNVIGLVLDYV